MKTKVKEFSFTNAAGGTCMSKFPMGGERFVGTAEVTLIRGFYDYETGWIFHGTAESEDLKAFLERNGSPQDRRVAFSQFDLVDQSNLTALMGEASRLHQVEFSNYMTRLTQLLKDQPENTAAKFDECCAVLHDGAPIYYFPRHQKPGYEFDNGTEPDISAWETPWRKELDDWFAKPEYFQLSEDDVKLIQSQFKA